MEKSFQEANGSSASQEIHHILWNLKVHDGIHKWPSTLPILSQIKSLRASPRHFLNIHVNSILVNTLHKGDK
jgi:hypothetical protein